MSIVKRIRGKLHERKTRKEFNEVMRILSQCTQKEFNMWLFFGLVPNRFKQYQQKLNRWRKDDE
jgi:hypothetical protein